MQDLGNGIERIEDETIAKNILRRVNDLNARTTLQSVAIAAVFAALPHSFTSSTALCAAIFAALYFLQGKIPTSA